MKPQFQQASIRSAAVITLCLAAALGEPAAGQDVRAPTGDRSHFADNVAPFLKDHCVACHRGDEAEAGIRFETYTDSSRVQSDYDVWEKALRLIRDRQMPPPEEEQPTSEELVAITDALRTELESFDCTLARRPGRVTLRRLNRAEYDNTIRDLTGLSLDLANDFPSDDVGYGFDNVGDVLTIPPVLLEKYLAAAETVAERVVEDDDVRKRVFPYTAENDEQRIETAQQNIREFGRRAFRRALTPDEEQRLFTIALIAWQQDSSEKEIFQTLVAAILSNPHFLFRVERDPDADDDDGIRELDGYELASRLSYFLWSTMPDDELFRLAKSGELTSDDVLVVQVERMLADPKARALVDNFAGQWLQLRDVSTLMPDPARFPGFDGELRAAMRQETELFFENMIRDNRSVLEFLTADFTYVNERLAQHYGMEGVTGSDFQRVAAANGRRGVLTHASILFLTSNPTRTSPVKRGKWILDNFLAEPPPPPPANVPELDADAETLGSLRERMEQHRSNPSCAVCHTKMDALGFGLENFDAIGSWRDRDGRYDVDASGELPGGRNFNGAADLMQILVEEKKMEFCRCLTQKLMTYALGRGLESYDRCAVNDVLKELEANDFRFATLVTSIVTSDPFKMREARIEP